MTDPGNTTARDLTRAAEIGKASGLRYVYVGKLPGHVGTLENTYCHGCGEMLVERFGYHVQAYRVTSEGRCPPCGVAVPGHWASGWKIPEDGAGLTARIPRAVHPASGPSVDAPEHGGVVQPEDSPED